MEVLSAALSACDGMMIVALKERQSSDPSGKGSRLNQASQVVCSVALAEGSSCDGHSSMFRHSRYLNTTRR